jgi:hypothetical protein
MEQRKTVLTRESTGMENANREQYNPYRQKERKKEKKGTKSLRIPQPNRTKPPGTRKH